VAKSLGVVNPKNPKMTSRVTFIIDKKGTIRKIYDKVDTKTHPDEVVKFVKENLAEKK
jgi:peroxiredoxin